MDYHLYSYWLTVKLTQGLNKTPSASLKDVLTALNNSYAAGKEYTRMVFDIDGDEISGEADPDEGAIGQDDQIAEAIGQIAAQFPDYTFEFDENDEEDHSIARHTKWVNGEKVGPAYRHVVEPNEYDTKTIDAVIQFLMTCHPNAANDVSDHFKKA